MEEACVRVVTRNSDLARSALVVWAEAWEEANLSEPWVAAKAPHLLVRYTTASRSLDLASSSRL